MLRGKTALITGASRGIGRAIAVAMADAGADIAAVYCGNLAAAEETRSEVLKRGVRCGIYRCDVADFNQCAETVAKAAADFSQLDILVNNAGVTRDKITLAMTEEDFDCVVDTSLKGAFNMIKHIYPLFMRRRAGRIINISSVSGLMGNIGQANYSAAKAGMIGLTKTIARELASRNVTCNAVAPGFIKTDMTDRLGAAFIEHAKEAIPMKRIGLPEDVAALTVFLAGDAAGYITGEVIKVDGGLYI